MDNINVEQNTTNTTPTPEAPVQPQPSRGVATIVIISLIFGFIGGYAGYSTASHSASMTGAKQAVTVTGATDVVGVVQKTSPAVVSIVVSKDISKISGNGNSPFNDPYFNYFFSNGQNQSPQSTTPNVQEVAAGSGFFISADGLIATNKHVVSDPSASYTVMTTDGKTYTAKVVAQDPLNDIAIVKIDIQNATFLSFADSSKIQIGEPVVAIGNSLGEYQNTVTSGIVSGIGRSVTAGSDGGSSEELSGVIQTDAAINPGNSGGPLLDMSGQVIGINTAIDQQGQSVGFALPSNDVSKDVASYQKNGHIAHPFLGIRYETVTQDLADQEKLARNYGALISAGQTASDTGVIAGSPASKAGLVAGDIILAVNGTKLDNSNTLAAQLNQFNPGDAITLHLYHNGAEKDVSVILGEAPAQ